MFADSLDALPIAYFSSKLLLPKAIQIAKETYRSLYDTLYLALALQEGGQFVTADRKCYDGIVGTPYQSAICWIGDVPTN